MSEPWVVLASLSIEAAFGYPQRLHARIPHPVVWAGRTIEICERIWNVPRWSGLTRRVLGCVTVALVAGLAALLGYVIEHTAGDSLSGFAAVAMIGTVGLTQRSLYEACALLWVTVAIAGVAWPR